MRPLVLIFGGLLFACAAQVGDECNSDLECGRGRLCDLASRAGYCTISPCREGSCPEEAVCVEFENSETYCMAVCDGDDDCRGGYSCEATPDGDTYCRQNP